MIIGRFRYEAESDRYTGAIRTLTLRIDRAVREPRSASGIGAPDYHFVATLDDAVAIGAAWRPRSPLGEPYLLVAFDEPSFTRPIRAALFLDDDGRRADLVWMRPDAGSSVPTAFSAWLSDPGPFVAR